MGKHDALVKKGLKVAQGWTDQSAATQAHFILAKKNNISWEKSAIKKLTVDVEGGGDMTAVLSEIDACRGYLKGSEDDLERHYAQHYKFVRGEPRAGAVSICAILKLKKDSEEWDAVLEGTKRALLDNTKQFADTENTWLKDVKPRIVLLKDKLNALEKIARGESRAAQSYLKLFQKAQADLVSQIKDSEVGLKTDQGQEDLQKMQQPDFMQGNEKALQVKLQSYELRVNNIPKIRALLTKNYQRTLKAIPPKYLAMPMWSRMVAGFEKTYKDGLKGLDYSESTFKTCVKVFKAKFPNI